MIRFSVIICLSVLLFSTSAKPYRPRVCPDPSCLFEQEEKDVKNLTLIYQSVITDKEKVFGKAVQDTAVFDLPDEKMILGMKEVEPPEDMDIADFDIDPNMLIWKAVKEEIQQKYNQPEEDKDALYHSFDIQAPADPKQPENYLQPLGHDRVRKYDKPEDDRDDLYHGMFIAAGEPMREEKDVIGGNVRPIYSSPEEDKDDLYHADVRGHQSDQQAQPLYIFPIRSERVHNGPEVDLDDLYHKQ